MSTMKSVFSYSYTVLSRHKGGLHTRGKNTDSKQHITDRDELWSRLFICSFQKGIYIERIIAMVCLGCKLLCFSPASALCKQYSVHYDTYTSHVMLNVFIDHRYPWNYLHPVILQSYIAIASEGPPLQGPTIWKIGFLVVAQESARQDLWNTPGILNEARSSKLISPLWHGLVADL